MIENNSEKLEGKLVESFKVDGLGELAKEYMELGLDLVSKEGVLKDIPIVGTIVQISKAVGSVRDILYLRKLVCFLQKIGETTQQQRDKFIEDNCQNVRQFEEAVFLILEQVDNINKSTLIGKIFKACILGMISYQDALSLSCIANKALWQDIENMLQRNFTIEMKMRLCNCGLLNLSLMRSTHIAQTMEPFVTEEKIDGFDYHENEYFKMLMKIAEL